MRKRFAALLLAVAFALTSIPGMTVYAGQNSGKTVQTQTEMGGVKTGSSSASETGAPAESKKETEASASAAQVETTPAEGNPPEESGKSETEASGQTLKAQETESVPFAASQVTENGIQVNVTADAGVFPDNTQMKVTPVSSSDVQPLIENKIEQASVTDMFAVDISFYCDGQKTEPDGNVNVSMSFPRSVSGDAAIWHVTDGQAEPVDASVSADTAKFSADSFSIYAIVGTEQKADLYTVNFYDGENLLRTQTIKNGDVLLAPSTPFHDGKTFLGWSSDDGKTFVTVGDDNVVTDLPENTGNTINLYAIYESTYKVTFYDVQGNIMDQMILPAGSTVDTSQYRCEIAEDEYIHTWTRNKDMSVNADGDTAGAGTVTVQDSDLAFYPLVKGVTWVFFNANSGDEDATYLEPEAVKNGSTLNAPENPARQGYTFDRWTRDPEGSQNYDFAGDVPSKLAAGGVLTLYAQWKEASTKYEVEIWRQVCKDGVYVEDNYEVADRFYVDGEIGAQIDPETVRKKAEEEEKKLIDEGTDVVGQETSLQYREINQGKSDSYNTGLVIKGDGTTVARVYYDMLSYTFEFEPSTRYGSGAWDGNTNWFCSFEAGGKVYTGEGQQFTGSYFHFGFIGNAHPVNTYSITLHPGEKTDALPHNIIAYNVKTGETKRPDRVYVVRYEWFKGNTLQQTSTCYWGGIIEKCEAQKSTTMPMRLFWPKSVNHVADNGKNVRLIGPCFTEATSIAHIHEMEETLDDDTYTDNTYTDVIYTGRSLLAEDMKGFEYISSDTLSEETKQKYQVYDENGVDQTNISRGATDGISYYCFYKRKKYSLYFYDDTDLLKSYTMEDDQDNRVKYQALLESYLTYEPEKPERYQNGDYEFAGWSTDGTIDTLLKRDALMPADDLKLYAVWVPKRVHAVIDANGGMYSDGSSQLTKTLDQGSSLSQMEVPTRPGYTFQGWMKEDGSDFNAATELYDDIHIYARWLQEDVPIAICYAEDDGHFVLSTETYSEGSPAVLAHQPEHIPAGKIFVGWRYGDEIKQNGDMIQMLSKYAEPDTDASSSGRPAYIIRMTACYVDEADAVSITYDANGGEGQAVRTYSKYQPFEVADADAVGITRNGYRFTGWNTKKDGTGTAFAAGSKAALDLEEPMPNILYAQWEAEPTEPVKPTDVPGQKTEPDKPADNPGTQTNPEEPTDIPGQMESDKPAAAPEEPAVMHQPAAQTDNVEVAATENLEQTAVSAPSETISAAPQTGDDSPILFYAALMMLSGGALLAAGLKRKRSRK